MADKILEHMNDRFDKLYQTLQLVQSSQKELVEKVESVKEEMLDQESCITDLEKMVSGLKEENNMLRLRAEDLEGGCVVMILKLSAFLSMKKRVNQWSSSRH